MELWTCGEAGLLNGIAREELSKSVMNKRESILLYKSLKAENQAHLKQTVVQREKCEETNA
jgi:hypothetical protein